MDTQRDEVLSLFGQRVREFRQAAGFSQEELAHRASLDRTYVSGIERGVRNISLLNLCRLAAALEIDPGKLVADLAGAHGDQPA